MNEKLPTPEENFHYAQQLGVNIDSSVVINGPIQVVRHPEAIISLAEGVVLNGHVAYNAIILANRTSLAALDPGAVIRIGKKSGLSSVTIAAAKFVSIGENTYVGADAMICDTDFHTPLEGGGWSDDHLASCAPIHIGDNCFIGARAVILKGVTIGNGSIVAANALVTRDVPPYHLAIGNPATVKPLSGKWLVHSSEKTEETQEKTEKSIEECGRDLTDLKMQISNYQDIIRTMKKAVTIPEGNESKSLEHGDLCGSLEEKMLIFYEEQVQIFRKNPTPWFLRPKAWLARWNRNALRKNSIKIN